MEAGFVHLNVHSEYSLVDSTIRCTTLAKHTQEQGMPAIAISDVMNFYATIKHYKSCIKNGIKPIIGVHAWVTIDNDFLHAFDVILLAINHQGFINLSEQISKAYLGNQHQSKAYLKLEELVKDSDNIILLSGTHSGLIGQLVLNDKLDQAKARCKLIEEHFKDRFYLEIQRVGRDIDDIYNGQAIAIAQELNLPMVATNAVQFINKEDFQKHEIRVCIQDSRLLADKRRVQRFTPEQYLKNAIQMRKLFNDIPQAIENTIEIAKRCNIRFDLDVTYLPNFEIKQDITAEELLIKNSQIGLKEILNINNENDKIDIYNKRLEHEINVINKMGFASYFLIVADFISWAKQHDIPVGPGRGSGAGSLVAYALGITELDPIKLELLFERFLNPDRISLPDFDIDFCMQGRDDVIQYVNEKYGRDRVAQIITFGTMAARAVVRDVGRVKGMGYGFVDKIAKLIPFVPGMTLENAMQQEKELASLYKNDQEIKDLIDNAQSLEGLVRNVGKHAGGVVIAPKALTQFSCLYAEQGSNQSITQFDKDDLESIGLVKFDFLGLKTLTIIDNAIKSINASHPTNSAIVIKDIDPEDEKTFTLLKNAKTTAVFQLESRGMKDLILRLQPDSFADLTALVALYRPGPMLLADDFVNRKHGREIVKYLHPAIEEILKPTYGVMLYQEQVMQIAQVLGGYTLASADILRKAMGKKNPEEMAKQRQVFVDGAKENDIREKIANSIFDLMEKFAGYGFNKAHSAAYAQIAYQTAWLKANYPAHFIAASLSADMENTDKIVILIAEAREMGLKISLPDINSSVYNFIVDTESSIFYGLGALKGLGQAVIEQIVEQRDANGRYTDLFNLCNRMGMNKLNKRSLEALVCSGAMDDFNRERSCLFATINTAVDSAGQWNNAKRVGQKDLFGIATNSDDQNFYTNPAKWSEEERLKREKLILGLYLSGHPIEQHRQEIDKVISARIVDLKANESIQVIAGLLIGIRTMFNRKSEKFAFVTLDDNTARIEVAIFSDVYERVSEILRHDRILIISGKANVDERTQSISMRGESVYSLAEYRNIRAKSIICSTNVEKLDHQKTKFRNLMNKSPRGKIPVILDYNNNNMSTQITFSNELNIYPENTVIYSLQQIFGQKRVQINYLTND